MVTPCNPISNVETITPMIEAPNGLRKTINVPVWVYEVLYDWLDTDRPNTTYYMEKAYKWKELRGQEHAKFVLQELTTCINENVLDDQVVPLYAAYGWVVIQKEKLQ